MEGRSRVRGSLIEGENAAVSAGNACYTTRRFTTQWNVDAHGVHADIWRIDS